VSDRSEQLRQRAVVLGLIRDDGPESAEELERSRDQGLLVGVTEDQICDQLEELMDACEEA